MNALSRVGPTPWGLASQRPSSRTLPGLVEEMSGDHPQSEAVVFDGQRLTYAQLASQVRVASAKLEGLGVGSGSRVAALAPNSALWLEVAFGSLRRGCVLHAFNTWVRTYDLEYLLSASEAEVLVMAATVGKTDMLGELRPLVPELWSSEPGAWVSERYPQLRSIVVLGGGELPSGALSWEQLDPGPAADSPDFSNPDDVATVLYTSGSTQYPKAVPLVHSTMIDNGFGIGERMRLTTADRVWLGSPLFWSFGIANAVMATMTHGACLVLQDRPKPATTADLLAIERCTAAYLLPTIVSALHEEVGARIRDLAHLRTGLTIGRPDEVEVVAHGLGIEGICNVYGSTETYGNCCVTPTDLPLEERLVSQGPPLPDVEVRIMEAGEVVRRGDPGEIQVRGHVMREYVGAPDVTQDAFTEDGWYRTGDTGLLRADGMLQFVGRHSEMIKTSGINVSPAEVESFLRRHPDVVDVVVVGAPHPTKGEAVVAFVIARQAVREQEVIDFCWGSVASYKIPTRVVLVEDFPRLSTGKIARKYLAADAAAAVQADPGPAGTKDN